MSLPIRAVWAHPNDAGMTRKSVDAFVGKLATHNVNAAFMHLKGGDGRLYWPSPAFPQAVAPGCDAFDFAAEFLDSCRRHGVQAHAWMIDFFDGGPAFAAHPEWAMRDPQGRTAAELILRGKPWGAQWMCPARRPGYADQWLVPVYREFAERYAYESVHHDYVRYPGDAAPDAFCFCDHCVEDIPRHCGLVNDRFEDEPFVHPTFDRPFLEAHWEPSPRVLPAAWDRWDRAKKAQFLLDGSFFPGGRADLDALFYGYRQHWIERFVRDSAQAVREARPGTLVSAAVFKHPALSGRFIAQDWRRFEGWVDWLLPMDYRDHFPGSWEHYLGLLEAVIARQKGWASGFGALIPGFAVNFLYREEFAAGLRAGPEKLTEVIDVIAACGVDGMCAFCAGQIEEYGLWDAFGSALYQHA